MEESKIFELYSKLPELTKYNIAEEYDYETLRAFCQSSNREALELCNDNAFWKWKTYHDFGDLYDIEEFGGNWRDIYEYHRGFFSWDLIKDLEGDNTDAIEKKMVANHKMKFLNVNGQDEEGKTALMWAASRDYGALVRELLALKANPNLQDDTGWTALMYASREGYTDIIRELLAAGANPDLKTESIGKTALIIAVHWDRENVIRELLNGGADPNIQENIGYTALMIASHDDATRLVRVLLEGGADPNITGNRGWTALLYASNEGHHSVVLMLLEGGADMEVRDGSRSDGGLTPLIWATYLGYETVVEILLENGADPFNRSASGETALELAIRKSERGYRGLEGIINMLEEAERKRS